MECKEKEKADFYLIMLWKESAKGGNFAENFNSYFMTKTPVMYLLLAFIVLFNASCENFSALTPEEKLLGVWETSDYLGKYTFNTDHTYAIDDVSFKENGTWFVKDNALYMEPEGKGFILKDDIVKLEEKEWQKSYVSKEGKTIKSTFYRKERFKDKVTAVISDQFSDETVTKLITGNWKYNNTNDEVLTFNNKNEYRQYRAGTDLMIGSWFVYNGSIYLQPLKTPYTVLKDKLVDLTSTGLTVSYIYNGSVVTDKFTKDDKFVEPLPTDHKTDFELANDAAKAYNSLSATY